MQTIVIAILSGITGAVIGAYIATAHPEIVAAVILFVLSAVNSAGSSWFISNLIG